LTHAALFPKCNKPLRIIGKFPHSWHVAHPHPDGSTGRCALWDIESDGRFLLECDADTCPLYGSPVELAADLGLAPECVHPADLELSALVDERRAA
jgi:hypothetical protein